MVMVVKDEEKKGVIDTLLDDDESFIVQKRRKEESSDIEDVVKKMRETIKKRVVEDVEEKREKEERPSHMERLERIKRKIESSATGIERGEIRKAEVKRVERRIERPYLSDVEINVIRAIAKYGPDLKRVARATGYPDIVVTKAVERLISKGYLDESLNISEKAAYLVNIPERSTGVIVRILDIGIIIAGIVLVISTLHYFGFIP